MGKLITKWFSKWSRKAGLTNSAILESLGNLEKGLSIAANIIHSIDGYIMREMVRMSKEQGFEMVGVHDSFYCCPNHMQKVRENYLYILMKIADSNLLENIIQQLRSNENLTLNKLSNDLSSKMKDAEYALS